MPSKKPTKKSPAKKSRTKKSAAKKPTKTPSTARKPTAKKKSAAKKAPAKKKSAAKKKSIATKAPAKKKSAAKRRAAPRILSVEERGKLLKPRTDFLDVLERVVREWDTYGALRAPGLTAAKLASLGKEAVRATERERAVEEALEHKLVPLADARRLAHDAAYRALLDTHAAIKLQARLDPGVNERFSFLSELVRNQAAPEVTEPTPVAAPAPAPAAAPAAAAVPLPLPTVTPTGTPTLQ